MTSTFGERPWFWEGKVQDALAAHLVSEGWEVREAADTESKAPGIDLLATKDHRWLAIRTEIVSRMCAEAPVHHAVADDDLERVGRGKYRVRGMA